MASDFTDDEPSTHKSARKHLILRGCVGYAEQIEGRKEPRRRRPIVGLHPQGLELHSLRDGLGIEIRNLPGAEKVGRNSHDLGSHPSIETAAKTIGRAPHDVRGRDSGRQEELLAGVPRVPTRQNDRVECRGT